MLARRYVLPIFFLLFLLFYGCGDLNIFEGLADDNTQKARLEEAQIALDSGDFTKAVDILLDLCGLSAANPASGIPTCDNDTRALLASAYMGRAGLDLIKIIDTAVNATGQQGTFTEFSTLFLDPNLSQTDMHNAALLLSGIQGRTQQQNLQMAVAATADTVLIIRGITEGFNQTTGLPNTVPSASDSNTINAANNISGNIHLIIDGVNGSGIANAQTTSDINTIQTSISGTDTTVTSGELTAYMCSLNPSATGC